MRTPFHLDSVDGGNVRYYCRTCRIYKPEQEFYQNSIEVILFLFSFCCCHSL